MKKYGKMSSLVLGIMLILPFFAPLFATHDPYLTSNQQFVLPTSLHWFGTDYLGRDLYSRFLWGGQRTILVSICSTLIAVGMGSILGCFSVFTAKKIRSGLLALFDALISVPPLLVSLLILTLLGNGVFELILATALPQIIPVAYVVRGAIVILKEREYVLVSRALGANTFQLIQWHIVPALLNTLLSYGMNTMRYCLMMSTTVTFLGFGGELGVADWGVMLAEARMAFRVAPWTSIPPGLGILAWVMWLNYWAEIMGQSTTKLK